MLHLLLLVDWVGALALADWKAPEDEESFDQQEADVRDAVEYLAADVEKRGHGPWIFSGSWGVDPGGDGPELDGEWRRLTGAEATQWCEAGLLWAKPAYLLAG